MTSLEYPCHGHALIHQEISENCTVACSMCKQNIQSTAYCCQEHCDFFVDESCASVEFPLQVRHYAHPEHMLILTAGKPSCVYDCRDCSFSLKAKPAIATLSTIPRNEHPDEEEDVLEHISHEHPLTSFHMNIPNWLVCKGCGLRLSGRVYGCRPCMFLLDESCARAPKLMLKHPFHPQHPLSLIFDNGVGFHCQACDTERHNHLAYHCQQCRVYLDMPCVSSIGSPSDSWLEKEHEEGGSSMIQHFSHRHPLKSFILSSAGTDICCKVCELRISDEVYCCPGCLFFLHKPCADELPQEIDHYLHSGHPLTFKGECQYEDRGFRCYCCSQTYFDIPSFHCDKCMFDLDPKCALQTLSASRKGIATSIKHFIHDDHPMTLNYKPNRYLFYDCVACGKEITSDGVIYRCRAYENYGVVLVVPCDQLALHQSCAELPTEIEHSFHSQHPLQLLPRSPSAEYFYCNACHIKSQGFTYYCKECDYHLDVSCASLMPTLKHQRHEHSLIYFQKSPYKYPQCNICKKSSRIDVYCCLICNFSMHHKCLLLPPEIEHECHPYHPLVLFDKFVDGDPNDQYCDLCEEIRNPDHGVYRCEKCWYSTHIDCVISRIESEADTLEQTEDPRLTKLNEEISSLEEVIKVMETNLEALTGNLEELKVTKEKYL